MSSLYMGDGAHEIKVTGNRACPCSESTKLARSGLDAAVGVLLRIRTNSLRARRSPASGSSRWWQILLFKGKPMSEQDTYLGELPTSRPNETVKEQQN